MQLIFSWNRIVSFIQHMFVEEMKTPEELKEKLIQDLTRYGVSSAYFHCGSLANLYLVFDGQKSRNSSVNIKIKELAKPFMRGHQHREDVMVSDMTAYTDRIQKLLPRGYKTLFEIHQQDVAC